MSTGAAPESLTPAATAVPYGLDQLVLEADLRPGDLADLLSFLPDDLSGLTRRDVTTSADSATVVYLAGEDGPKPQFGMAVILLVAPAEDADDTVSEIQETRWGPVREHTVTGSGAGTNGTPAFREFWRVFPPGLFAIPNQPIYFLISYRANDVYAYMVIGSTAEIRQVIAEALVATLAEDSATPTA
jgi:hypothetical protein